MNHDIKTYDLYPALHATALNILEAESAIQEWKEVINSQTNYFRKLVSVAKTTDPDFPAWKEVLDNIRAELTTDEPATYDPDEYLKREV